MAEKLPEFMALQNAKRDEYKRINGELMSEKVLRLKIEKQAKLDAIEKAKF